MLLDVTVIVVGLTLAVAGFAVVILVTVIVLRLLGVVLGDDGGAAPDAESGVDAVADAPASTDADAAGGRMD